MRVITFYSYKGGVGRTMALVNVAAELVRRGRKVLVVDFDLEAPGLETYKQFQPKDAPKQRPGIVEYVSEYRRTYKSPDLCDYIYETKPIGKKGGKLWVMPAGRRDHAYRQALVNLDWKKLYNDQDGFLLFEDAKKGWEVEYQPDYVLIDSRTGDTDVKGICTRQLPDSVVLLFIPNEQNLAGLLHVCRAIRREETEGLKKKIKLHFVASNVPDLDDDDHRLRLHLNRFREKLEINQESGITIIHRSVTLQVFDQPIVVLERPRSRLAGDYKPLVRALQVENPEDPEGAVLFLKELYRGKPGVLAEDEYFLWGPNRVAPLAGRQLDRLTELYWNDSEILFKIGQCLSHRNEPRMAIKRFSRVLELQPNHGLAALERGLCHKVNRSNVSAAADFHFLLNSHGNDPTHEYDNETVLLHLLDISLDEFLRALNQNAVIIPGWEDGDNSHNGGWLLSRIPPYLIDRGRWDDTIAFLENRGVKKWIESDSVVAPSLSALRCFYNVIATWGKVGDPPCELASHAITQFESLPSDYCPETYAFPFGYNDPYILNRVRGSRFQDMALLYWIVGDSKKAVVLIDQVIALAQQWSEEPDSGYGISSWNFQQTTLAEFRDQCREIRRLFLGEPVRPPFLSSTR